MEQMGEQLDSFGLEYFNIQSGNVSVPTATVRLKSGGERLEEAATGDGPVDAVFNAIDRATGIAVTLLEFNVHAVTPGRQAMGEVSVGWRSKAGVSWGEGASTDILEASARAYLNAINRFKATNK